MAKEKFLLVSLNESKSKQLAQAISNESCRKILDYLADKEATESELSLKLNIPISTVHYNLQQLQKGGLVVVDEYHYSEKGKEINHYKLANKYIIIAPRSTYGIKEKLRSILPAALLIAVGAGFIQLFTDIFGRNTSSYSMKEAVLDTAPLAEKVMAQGASESSNQLIPRIAETTVSTPNVALWFLIGAIAAIIIYLLVDYIRSKK
jgi:DNA-binding transcriptional ArsR family regulator